MLDPFYFHKNITEQSLEYRPEKGEKEKGKSSESPLNAFGHIAIIFSTHMDRKTAPSCLCYAI